MEENELPIPSKEYIEGFLDGCLWFKRGLLGEEPDNDFIKDLKKLLAEEMKFIDKQMEEQRMHYIEKYLGLGDKPNWSFLEKESGSAVTDP